MERREKVGYKDVMRRIAAYLCIAALLLAGCGRSETSLTPVQGRVFFRGQPLPGGTIVFTPDPDRGGRGPQSWAEIDPEGNYSLKTDGKDGAVACWHRVTVAPLSQPDYPISLPSRYRDPDRSGQLLEVRAGGTGRYDLYLD